MLVERRGHGEIAQLDAEVYAADDFHGVLAFLAARDVEHQEVTCRLLMFTMVVMTSFVTSAVETFPLK